MNGEVPKITDWIQAMAGSASVVIALIGTIIALLVIRQNSKTIEAANNQLKIAMPPNIEVHNPDESNGHCFVVRNNSGYPITSIEIFVGRYATTAGARPLQIEETYRGPYPVPNEPNVLEQNATIALPSRPIVGRYVRPFRTPENNTFDVISLRYRRPLDNQRFCHVHLYYGWIEETMNPPVVTMPIDGTAASGGGAIDFLNRSAWLVIKAERETLGFWSH